MELVEAYATSKLLRGAGGISLMAELQFSKLLAGVRFSYPAQIVLLRIRKTTHDKFGVVSVTCLPRLNLVLTPFSDFLKRLVESCRGFSELSEVLGSMLGGSLLGDFSVL